MDFNKGFQFYQEGKFEEALAIFDQLIIREKGKTELHLYRGRILTRMGKGELALEDFDLLTSLEPYNTDFISDRGVVLHLMGRNDEALAELDRAANLDPRNPYRYSSRAFLKDRLGDFQGAIEDYEKAIELDPEDAVAFNNKGLVEEKLGQIQRAKKSFEKADELVGYKPAQKSDDLPPIEEKKSTSIPKPSFQPTESNQKASMNAGHFWDTLKSVFGDQKTRKEFLDFVKRIFSGKKPKDA